METVATKTNTGIVQQCYADFASGNIEGLLNSLQDDIVWVDPGHVGNVYKGTRKGKSQVLDFFKNLSAEVNITRFDVLNISECGDKVYVEGYLESNGIKSGLPASSDWLMVWQLQNGKVKYHHLYLDTSALALALLNKANSNIEN
jgi:ketosteroid isomerase-like protein